MLRAGYWELIVTKPSLAVMGSTLLKRPTNGDKRHNAVTLYNNTTAMIVMCVVESAFNKPCHDIVL